MTRHRELEARLALFDELSGILNAMRSFALAELRRVGRREAAQRQADEALASAVADVASALPQAGSGGGDLWILLGSVRGFCGSFNEDLMSHWRARQERSGPAIMVGERLPMLLPAADTHVSVPGAIGASDLGAAIDRIVAAVDAAGVPGGLVICFHDDAGVAEQRVLPVPMTARFATGRGPATFEPLARIAAGVARHFVFHRLASALLHSLRVENQMRLLQMENALQHIGRRREDLRRSRNQLRQEDIIEEIELIAQRQPR